MSLLDKASLVITPNATKASKLYSVIPSDGSGDMTVVRATTATRVNSNGLIESVALNVPRIDYTDITCPSILVEPQRTNLLFPSDIATTQTKTVTAQAYTLSFYGTGSIVVSGVFTGTLVGTGLDNRVSLTFTPIAGSVIFTVSGSVLNWQLEQGSYATSYIPTVAASVTRNADVISKTGVSDLIGQTEGTIFFDGLAIGETEICNINQSIVNSVFLYVLSGKVCGIVFADGTTLNMISTINSSTRFKAAIAYKSNDIIFYVNGQLISQQTSETFTPNVIMQNFYIAQGNYVQGKEKVNCNSAQLYKTRLTNAELATLTTL